MTMMAKKFDEEDPLSELSLAAIEYWKSKGHTQSWIARKYGVTRQAVSWWISYYGGHMTPRQIVLQHFPWQVPAKMSQQAPYKLMRDHGEFVATAGEGMSETKLKRLRSWYRRLREEGLVLEFDPTLPPVPGVANKGGFAYRSRLPGDDDLLIRVNEYTDLTEKGREIWILPQTDP